MLCLPHRIDIEKNVKERKTLGQLAKEICPRRRFEARNAALCLEWKGGSPPKSHNVSVAPWSRRPKNGALPAVREIVILQQQLFGQLEMLKNYIDLSLIKSNRRVKRFLHKKPQLEFYFPENDFR